MNDPVSSACKDDIGAGAPIAAAHVHASCFGVVGTKKRHRLNIELNCKEK